MIGAVLTVLLHGPAVQAVFPFAFLVILAVVAYVRRPAFRVNRVKA